MGTPQVAEPAQVRRRCLNLGPLLGRRFREPLHPSYPYLFASPQRIPDLMTCWRANWEQIGFELAQSWSAAAQSRFSMSLLIFMLPLARHPRFVLTGGASAIFSE